MRLGPARNYLSLLTACAPAAFAQPAPVQPSQPPDPAAPVDMPAPFDLDNAVAALDAESFALREQAAEQIASGATLPRIEQRLAKSDLSLEQRARLNDIGFRLFSDSDRGALGVTFSRNFEDIGGTEIMEARADYDAGRVLRPGDVLASLGGAETPTFAHARVQIISFDPGETVELAVLRRGERVTARVKLGSLSVLHNGTPQVDGASLLGAWNARLERRGVHHDDPVLECGLSADRVEELKDLSAQAMPRFVIRQVQQRRAIDARLARAGVPGRTQGPPPTRVVAGGSARGADVLSRQQVLLTQAAKLRSGNSPLDRQIEAMETTIRQYESILANDDFKGPQRRTVEMQIEQLRAKLGMLTAERQRALGLVQP